MVVTSEALNQDRKLKFGVWIDMPDRRLLIISESRLADNSSGNYQCPSSWQTDVGKLFSSICKLWQISKYTVVSVRIIAWGEVIINDPRGTLLKRLNAIALFNRQTCVPCRARVLSDWSYHGLVEAEQVTGWHASSIQLLKESTTVCLA